jgi:hypothetical protein
MDAKERFLTDKFVIDGFVFRNDTPIETANKLIDLIKTKERVTLDYGYLETKKSWNEKYDISGRVGYSSGSYGLKYPLLIHNKRSLGGGLIITNHILTIKLSKGKKLIFEHK